MPNPPVAWQPPHEAGPGSQLDWRLALPTNASTEFIPATTLLQQALGPKFRGISFTLAITLLFFFIGLFLSLISDSPFMERL